MTSAAVGSGSAKDIGLVRDGSGVLHVIWEVGSVTGSKKIIDTPIAADGTVLKSVSLPAYDERIPITGYGKGKAGVWAYLTGNPHPRAVSLLKFGSTTPVAVGSVSTGFIDGDAVTAAPNGRLWVTWWYGGTDLYTRVSGTTGTMFGKTVRIPVPSGTTAIWTVYTSAQSGRLDALALLTRDGKIAYYATQVLLPAPGPVGPACVQAVVTRSSAGRARPPRTAPGCWRCRSRGRPGAG